LFSFDFGLGQGV